jgi:intracellular sulfur oxidation DsrE/DsrF family protein
MDELPGSHRFIFDNVSPSGFDASMLYAGNFITVNGADYGVGPDELAVIIVARHNSTPFAFNDAMWEKYGAAFAERMGFVDPQTNAAPTRNVYRNRLEGLASQNLQLAVCGVATRGFAGAAARATGGDTETVLAEITRNLVPNSHMTPAGIVAVNRAQERGYSFSFAA